MAAALINNYITALKTFFQDVCQEQFLVAAAGDICCVQQDSSEDTHTHTHKATRQHY